MNAPVTLKSVRVHGLWMPCEYETHEDKVIIRCLGDIDRACLDLPHRLLTLPEALEQYFQAVPPARKMVVLVPREGISRHRWACRQAPKSHLVAEINEFLECSAV